MKATYFFVVLAVGRIILGQSACLKILIIELKKLKALCQYNLHMKPTVSLYSVIQQCGTNMLSDENLTLLSADGTSKLCV